MLPSSRKLVLIVCLLLAVLPVAAQTADPINLDDTATVVVPNGWELYDTADYTAFFDFVTEFEGSVLAVDDVAVLILTPTQVDALLGADASDDPIERFVALQSVLYDYDLDASEVEADTVFGYDAQRWYYVVDGGEGEAYLLSTDETSGAGFFVDLLGPVDALEAEPLTSQVDSIFESLTLIDADTPDTPAATAELAPGIEVALPEGWEATPAGEFDSYFADIPNLEATILANEDIWILILTPDQVEALLDGDETEDAASLLIDIYKRLYDEKIDSDQLEEVTIGSVDAAVWYYFYENDDEDDTQGEAYVFPDAATGASFFVDIYGSEGTLEPNADDLNAILESIAALSD